MSKAKEEMSLEEMLEHGMSLEELQEQLHWARVNGADEAYDIISNAIRKHRAANKE
jgi:hypothetical protein